MTGLVLAFLTGALVVMCWNGSWFVIDAIADWLRQPDREQLEDQAMAVANTPAREVRS